MAAPLSSRVEDAGLEAEAQVLVQANPRVGLTLRFVELVESAHLGFVVGTGPDLRWAADAKLPVAGGAVPGGGQARDEPRHDLRLDLRALEVGDGVTISRSVGDPCLG